MATKIRLARHGRKGHAVFHLVVADSRAPRDGKYIEKLGIYDPNTNPATIEIAFDRALYWVGTGAQPTITARRILSYKGVLMKKHLLDGVKKGAFDEATAEAKFEAWLNAKNEKVAGKVATIAKANEEKVKSVLAAESETRAAKEMVLAEKKAEMEAAAAAAAKEAEAAQAEAEAEAPAEEAAAAE